MPSNHNPPVNRAVSADRQPRPAEDPSVQFLNRQFALAMKSDGWTGRLVVLRDRVEPMEPVGSLAQFRRMYAHLPRVRQGGRLLTAVSAWLGSRNRRSYRISADGTISREERGAK